MEVMYGSFIRPQMKCMHLREKTEDMPTQRDKTSNLGVKTDNLVKMLKVIAQIDTIAPWCTRIYQSPRAPHRAGGQAGCGHANPRNGAAFPG
ncbi:hypothetical protein TNCV_96011 [Trichonephila clavipes]|nr:hypothetical protein TNCV_96011 [Trichonephila clavipes]